MKTEFCKTCERLAYPGRHGGDAGLQEASVNEAVLLSLRIHELLQILLVEICSHLVQQTACSPNHTD